jgi:hypothetical protein
VEDGRDFATWYAAMNGAKCSVTISNNGNATVDIKAVMLGTDGNTYTQQYKGYKIEDSDDFYVRFSVDGSHLVFE